MNLEALEVGAVLHNLDESHVDKPRKPLLPLEPQAPMRWEHWKAVAHDKEAARRIDYFSNLRQLERRLRISNFDGERELQNIGRKTASTTVYGKHRREEGCAEAPVRK